MCKCVINVAATKWGICVQIVVDVVTEKGALFYWHICRKQTQLTVVGGGQCIYVCVCMLNGGMVTIE